MSLKLVLLSIRDYVKLAAPEPEVLRIMGQESKHKGTNKLNSRQIDQVIKTVCGQIETRMIRSASIDAGVTD
jgi:hypothetical protein